MLSTALRHHWFVVCWSNQGSNSLYLPGITTDNSYLSRNIKRLNNYELLLLLIYLNYLELSYLVVQRIAYNYLLQIWTAEKCAIMMQSVIITLTALIYTRHIFLHFLFQTH